MKKILMGSFVLTALSLSIIAFQLSCSKTADAQTGGSGTGLSQLNKIIYAKANSNSQFEIWTSNYDGSNQVKVDFTIPIDYVLDATRSEFRLSPDGKAAFIKLKQSSNGIYSIFSCKVDGSNLTKIVSGNGNSFPNQYVYLGGAY